MAIAYIFHFHVVRVDFGLVPGDVRGSGLGISLFRFMQVPSKVPDGLMQVNGVVCFWDWGLFWAISGRSSLAGPSFLGACAWRGRVISRPPGGLEKNCYPVRTAQHLHSHFFV